MDKRFTASEVRHLSNRIPRNNDEIADAQEALRAYADRLEADEKAVPVELDFYDAGLLNDFGGGNVIWWWDYMRDELGRAHSFYQSQVNDMMLAAHSAQAQPKPSAQGLADRIMEIIHPHLDTGDSRTAAGWAVEIYHAICTYFGTAQPQAASVPDVMDDYREGIQQIRAVLAAQENRNG